MSRTGSELERSLSTGRERVVLDRVERSRRFRLAASGVLAEIGEDKVYDDPVALMAAFRALPATGQATAAAVGSEPAGA